MKGWKEYKLNELGKVNRGKSKHRPRNDSSLYGGPYPFIQTGDVKAANFRVTDYTQTYSTKGLAQSKLWQKGTLCITIAANIAETAILGIDACFPDSIIGFVADDKKSDVQFIKYHFDLLKLHLQSISQGTTQDNLSQDKLLRFAFTVPEDVIHQKSIASILSAYDELIEVNSQRIRLLEDTARELYKEWFVRLRFHGYKEAKFVKGVPEGWEVGTCYSIAQVKGGGTPSTTNPQFWEGSIPFFTPTDHAGNTFIFQTEKNITVAGLKSSSTRLFQKHTTFITARGTVGNICLAGEAMAMNQSCFALLAKKPQDNFFLFLFVDLMVRFLKQVASGATFDAVTLKTFHNYKALIPSTELRAQFNILAEPIFQQIETLQQQSTQLRQIRDRLLPRLISGKLQLKEEVPAKRATIIDFTPPAMVAEEAPEYGSGKAPNPLFTRRVLAAYIIDRLHAEPTFGHVKLMKLMYLCEHLAHIETAAHYHRDAAGPYDNQMIRSIDSQLKKVGWFDAVKQGTDKFAPYKYFPLAKKDEYKPWFNKYYSNKQVGIDRLIALFGTKPTEKVEMVATLYEAWRYLKEDSSMPHPGDDVIIGEVLKNWHVSKERISEAAWRKCLTWMREEQGWVM